LSSTSVIHRSLFRTKLIIRFQSKASGTGFSNEYIWIFHISGGKITSMKQFGDAQVLAAHLAKQAAA
jgi:ketosteroid isomerase-like protein